MRVQIRRKFYDLVFTSDLKREDDGLCDPPDKPAKQIKVRSTLAGERRLEVTIHELLHAAYWDVDESAIAEAAEDVARILWRLGYRQESQK